MQGGQEMRLLLIMPDADIHKISIGKIKRSFREAPLTLTTLAALIPKEINCEVRIIDESIDKIPFEQDFDLIGISCLTGTVVRAYEIADFFKEKGVTVVLGGVHISFMPEEAAAHADTIVSGFAEETWPELLRDFVKGKMKSRYSADSSPSLVGLPEPRRELQKRGGYMVPNTVFATRGCRGKCEFCTVPAVPFGWHTRPIGDVINEIRNIKTKMFAFNDVNLCEDREYAIELFNAIAPLKKRWGGLATVSIVNDTELMEAMKRSGCIYLLTGFESVNEKSLNSISKRFNKIEQYRETVEIIHSYNIALQGCFILGLDSDTTDSFKQTVELVNYLKIDIPRYAIFTPYPGTPVYKKMKQENRIIHENWKYYDTKHVVFRPHNMTPEELQKGFENAYRQTFSISSILSRCVGSPHPAVTFAGNLAYKFYINRMRRRSAAESEYLQQEIFV